MHLAPQRLLPDRPKCTSAAKTSTTCLHCLFQRQETASVQDPAIRLQSRPHCRLLVEDTHAHLHPEKASLCTNAIALLPSLLRETHEAVSLAKTATLASYPSTYQEAQTFLVAAPPAATLKTCLNTTAPTAPMEPNDSSGISSNSRRSSACPVIAASCCPAVRRACFVLPLRHAWST